MKFLKNIENETISIKKMGIIKTFLVLLLSILLEVVGQVPIVILDVFSNEFGMAAPYMSFMLGVLVKYFIIIILLRAYGTKENKQRSKPRLNSKAFMYTALVIVAFRLIFDNSLGLWINNIAMPDFINEAFEELAISPIILILTVAIIAPIYEEVVFRGILLKGMAKKVNPILALIVSALFFAVVHFNIPQGINAFLLGLVIGAIYLKTGSIYLSIFAHFMNNAMAITVSGLFLIQWKYAVVHGVFFIIGVILLVVASRGIAQNKTKNVPEIYKEFIEI